MTCHALVVEDNRTVIEDVKDRLACLGHTCDCVECVDDARARLAATKYCYALLDLEIPVRCGGSPRVGNGLILLRNIRQMTGFQDMPIIVITSHGSHGPHLAIQALRGNGATDFVCKPFPDSGHTLEQAIHDALAVSDQSRRGGVPHVGPTAVTGPQPFQHGELVYHEDRIELCGVKVCGGPESGLIRRILEELGRRSPQGTLPRLSGEELARRVGGGCSGTRIIETIATFRTSAARALLAEANIKADRLRDIIVNDRRHGYWLSPKITVRDPDDPVSRSVGHGDRPVRKPAIGHDDPVNGSLGCPGDPVTTSAELNERQRWALDRMRAGEQVRRADIRREFSCSEATVKRDLAGLRARGLIEFIGAPKTGHYGLVPTSREAAPEWASEATR